MFASILLTCLVFSLPSHAEDYGAYLPRTDPVSNYHDAIEQAEVDNGPYSMELADLYLGLGQSLLEAREFKDARKAFYQGAQLVRVNSGLNSPKQTNYLFSIADIDHRLGNWDSANDALNYTYLINSNHYGENDPGMMPVLERMYDWYSSRRPMESSRSRYADMQRYDSLAGKMAAISEQVNGLSHPQTTAAYRTIGQIQFSTVRYLLQGGDTSVEPGLVLDTGVRQLGGNADKVSVESHFLAGTEAFIKAAESVGRFENIDPLVQAEALAQLGDWYLAIKKFPIAGETYQQAYQLLAGSDLSKPTADTYFSDPIPLRFMRKELSPVSDETPDETAVEFTVSMTVTRHGKAHNVRILNPPEGLEELQVRRITRKLRDLRYRPRLVDGMPEKVDNFVWNYPLQQNLIR